MLKNIQKKYLKTLAHTKKPIIIIGNNGLTPAVLEEIDKALLFHELIKIKVNATDRENRDIMIKKIESEMMAELVQRVGHTATFFRRNPDSARIDLPN